MAFLTQLSYKTSLMRVTLIAVLLGVTGAGLLLLKVGGWYFEHRSGSAGSASRTFAGPNPSSPLRKITNSAVTGLIG
jgi:hypothetical protein